MRWLLLGALALSACTAAQPPVAPREVSGVVHGELRLSGAVVLAGDLLVPSGSRLVIAAGTVVTVQPAEGTKIDPEFLSSQVELLVRGSLHIDGTASEPVIFTVAGATGSEPGWSGITLDGASDSVLHHLRLSAAEHGLLLIDSQSRIEHVAISGCRYGIVVQGGAPEILATRIENGEGGVFLWNGATPLLDDVLIAGHAEEGLSIDRDSRPRLTGVRSVGNDIGLAAPADWPASGLVLAENRAARRDLLPRTGEGR